MSILFDLRDRTHLRFLADNLVTADPEILPVVQAVVNVLERHRDPMDTLLVLLQSIEIKIATSRPTVVELIDWLRQTHIAGAIYASAAFERGRLYSFKRKKVNQRKA